MSANSPKSPLRTALSSVSMPMSVGLRLSVQQRRRAQRLVVWNAALWSVGNGLASTTLILYLAYELNVPRIGLGISLILAMPHIAGLLRLGAPAAIERLADRKRFCIYTFGLSAVLLFVLPWLAAPGQLPSNEQSLAALILLWCGYHLMQYLGMVALWSWLADLAPKRVRGRFLGWRERWLMVGQAGGALCAGLFAWKFPSIFPKMPLWIAYAVGANVGVGFMLAALVPLQRMPSPERKHPATRPVARQAMMTPFRNARFLRLLVFGCWFSFFNGVTQSAQNLYPMRVLGVTLLLSLSLQTTMRVGQSLVSPFCGRMADRYGNRPVMMVCQVLVAVGLLCFPIATRELWGWWAAAWILWIAYAGLNVGLPNLMLKLSPSESNTPYIAVFYAITGLCYATSTILGGWAVDHFCDGTITVLGDRVVLDGFTTLFLLGFVARCLGAVLLYWIIESPRSQLARMTP